MPSNVTAIPLADLSELSTRQLLALRDRLVACEETCLDSDLTPDEIGALDPAAIRFREDARWTRYIKR